MEFNPDKLETTFVEPMTPYGPIEGRKYTLTHSDETGMLFLDIAGEYNYNMINENLRDELLGRWNLIDDSFYSLLLYAYVGYTDYYTSLEKYNSFKYHMEIALQAIVYGDRELLNKYPTLLNSPIYVKFESSIPMFDGYEFFGNVKDYVLK